MKKAIQNVLEFISDAWGLFCIGFLFISYIIFVGCFILGAKISKYIRKLKS